MISLDDIREKLFGSVYVHTCPHNKYYGDTPEECLGQYSRRSCC